MRKVYSIIIICFLTAGASAQNVAIVNGKPISNKEFIWFYKKNHAGNTHASYKELEDYLNLYVNFKLKVVDAKELGLDKDTAYVAEIKNYETALSTQKRISKTNAEYSLIMNEYKDAVLMFNVAELKVWNKAQNDESQLRTFYNDNKSAYPQSSFEEARGQVITDYQEKLENEWVEALKKKYSVRVYPNEIKKLAKL